MRHNLGLDNPGIPGNVDLAKKKGPQKIFGFAEDHPGSGNPVFDWGVVLGHRGVAGLESLNGF